MIYEDEEILFDAGSTIDTSSDLKDMDYHWDFGDGTESSGKKVWHDYSISGDYTVTLKVKDDNGLSDVMTKNITVLNPTPEAVIDGDLSVEEGMTGIYRSISNDNPSDRLFHKWGTGEEGRVMTRRWEESGDKSIDLRVIDDDKAENSADEDVHVINTNPHPFVYAGFIKADVRLRIAGEPGHDLDMVLYEDDEPIHSFYVERGTGEPQTDMVEDIVFDLSKTYTAQTIYTPEDDTDSGPNGANPAWIDIFFEDGTWERVNHTFNVVHPETYWWNVTINEMLKCHDAHFKARIFDQGKDDVKVTWDWGDDTVVENEYSSSESPTVIDEEMIHSYEMDGEYTLTVTAEDQDGGIDVYELKITQGNGGIYVDNFAPDVEAGENIAVNEDEEFTLSGTVFDNQEDVGYSWSTGGGTERFLNTSFGHQGEYMVVLKVTDGQGDSGYDHVFVNVENVCPSGVQQEDIVVTEDEVDIFDAAGVEDTLSDEINYYWDFGDGSTGYGTLPDKSYSDKGLYEVSMIAVDDNNCTFIDEFDVTVENDAPVIYSKDFSVYEDQTVTISAEGCYDTKSDIDGLNYVWISPTFETFHSKSFSYQFTQKGEYPFQLRVEDKYSSTEKTININVLNPSPTISLQNYRLYGEKVNYEFAAHVYDNPSDNLEFTWKWGDGSTSKITNEPRASHEYTTSDVYTLTLQVNDGDGFYTEDCTVYVGVDDDRDGLTNGVENNIGTDKSNPDTDGDFILDYYESNQYYQTDPTKEDTDDDGMLDWYELSYFGPDVDLDNDGLVCQIDWDSDGDMIADGREESEDLNPKVYNDPNVNEAGYEGIMVDNEKDLTIVLDPTTADIKPKSVDINIMEIDSPPEQLNGIQSPYYLISSVENFDRGYIKKKINQVDGELSWYKYTPNGWKILYGGIHTGGIDENYDYIWTQIDSFGLFSIADSNVNDVDSDGLNDAQEVSNGVIYGSLLNGQNNPTLNPNNRANVLQGGEEFIDIWELDNDDSLLPEHADIYVSLRKTCPDEVWARLEISISEGDYIPIWKYELEEKSKWHNIRGLPPYLPDKLTGVKVTATSPDVIIDDYILSLPCVETPPTHPNIADTDGDGLMDGEELNMQFEVTIGSDDDYYTTEYSDSGTFEAVSSTVDQEWDVLSNDEPLDKLGWVHHIEIGIDRLEAVEEVQVEPGNIENFRVNYQADNERVRLMWWSYEGADSYNILKKEQGEDDFNQIDNVVDDNIYFDSPVDLYHTYVYKIEGLDTNNDVIAESPSEQIYIIPGIDLSVNYDSNNHEVDLSWSGVPNNADEIMVYKRKAGLNWNIISTLGGSVTSYTDTGTLEYGYRYYYKIKAYEQGDIIAKSISVSKYISYPDGGGGGGQGPCPIFDPYCYIIRSTPFPGGGSTIQSAGDTSGIQFFQKIYDENDNSLLDTEINLGIYHLEPGDTQEDIVAEYSGFPTTYFTEENSWDLEIDNYDDHEYVITGYNLKIYHYLNPLDDDSDGDGLNDALEVNGWDSMVEGEQKHFVGDPLDATDRDGDELGDYEEWRKRSDPGEEDTDDDGTIDGYDLYPLTDMHVYFLVYGLEMHGDYGGFPTKETPDPKLTIDTYGEKYTLSRDDNWKIDPSEISNYGKLCEYDINEAGSIVEIKLDLVDVDTFSDDVADLGGDSGKTGNIIYDVLEDKWSINGQAKGRNHVISGDDDNYGEVWFDIFQDDNDEDMMAYGLELEVGTDPGVNDTDGDDLWDGYEYFMGLDPFSVENNNGRDGDLDGDGLTNYQEQEISKLKTGPNDWYHLYINRDMTMHDPVYFDNNIYSRRLCKPSEWDTDKDLIYDGYEEKLGLKIIGKNNKDGTVFLDNLYDLLVNFPNVIYRYSNLLSDDYLDEEIERNIDKMSGLLSETANDYYTKPASVEKLELVGDLLVNIPGTGSLGGLVWKWCKLYINMLSSTFNEFATFVIYFYGDINDVLNPYGGVVNLLGYATDWEESTSDDLIYIFNEYNTYIPNQEERPPLWDLDDLLNNIDPLLNSYGTIDLVGFTSYFPVVDEDGNKEMVTILDPEDPDKNTASEIEKKIAHICNKLNRYVESDKIIGKENFADVTVGEITQSLLNMCYHIFVVIRGQRQILSRLALLRDDI
ncbi:MAG: PKD domain-containing protein [Thermoplasmata archaeon]